MEYSVLKKVILVCYLVIFCNPNAYASLPDFTALVEAVAPAVVKINTVSKPVAKDDQPRLQGQMPEIFRELLEQRQRPVRPSRTMGSGFVISDDGYILTNHHVVDKAEEIQVQFADRSEYTATIIGSDRRSDLALLKIDAKNLPSLKFAESDSTKVGAWVLAIGSPFGLDYSVTAGIVSAIGRSLPTEQGENYVPFIQTDVAINRGNSGGPLFNLDGQVVGINSQIYSPTGGSVGLSFSIPVSIASNVVAQLRDNGKVKRGFLGVGISDVSKSLAEAMGLPSTMGAGINSVMPGSAADNGGIFPGDIIVSVNGQSILRSGDLPHIVGLIEPGKSIKIVVYREGKQKKLTVKVGALEGDEDALASRNEEADRLGIAAVAAEQSQLRSLRLRGGIVVSEVLADSPADVAGLKVDDIIVQLGYSRIDDLDEYDSVIGELPTNTPVAIRFYRGGNAVFRTIQINQ
jgi:serine protease Do|tara:strand:+ start:2730 stop:4112 length:1383 start_codon:yes stop_codon:yes gene_type:complete